MIACFNHLCIYEELGSQFDIIHYEKPRSSYEKVKPRWLNANAIAVLSTPGGSRSHVYTNPIKIRHSSQGGIKL
jgi:hypothetical protein